MKKIKVVLWLVGLVLTAVGCFSAPYANKVTLYANYTNNMVLQRDKPVAVSGVADPLKVVVLKLDDGDDDETYKNIADENGQWRIVIPARPADGKKYTLSVYGASEDQAIVCSNVVFGDIWICSGQSNMEMPVQGVRFFQTNNAAAEVQNANYPDIRLFNATEEKYTSIFDIQREPKAKNGWQICTPQSVSKFSALGYFFGRKLNQDLNVPIGLISAAWSGSPIEPWISLDGYKKYDRYNEINLVQSLQPFRDDAFFAAKYREKMTVLNANFKLFRQRLDRQLGKENEDILKWKSVDFIDDNWQAGPPVFAPETDGVMGFRYTLELPEAWEGKSLRLSLGPIDDVDETFFNGEQIGETSVDTVDFWQKDRTYEIPGKLVKSGKNVIYVRVLDFGNGGGLYGNAEDFFVSDAFGKKIGLDLTKWRGCLEYALGSEQLSKLPRTAVDIKVKSPWTPTTLFNSMLAPWSDYAMRGMIWYQGCSNAGKVDYYELHKMFIEDVRFQRGDAGFPFILVQLAGFGSHKPAERPDENTWKSIAPSWNNPFALTREIQGEMLNIPNVGMAVALDIGDQFDIHPGNKQELGRRLALEAERIVYGYKNLTGGPKFDRVEFGDKAVRIYFKNVANNLDTQDGQDVGGLMLEYSDGSLEWVNGRADGDSVIIKIDSTNVNRPVAVAYGWFGYRGDANLINSNGAVALPFRSNQPNYKNLEKIKP